MKSLTICHFSESVTTSDGYCRGYVSFAHFLLYFVNYKLGQDDELPASMAALFYFLFELSPMIEPLALHNLKSLCFVLRYFMSILVLQ